MNKERNHEKPKILVKIEHGEMVEEQELAVEKWEEITSLASCGTILTPASDVILCSEPLQFSGDVKVLKDTDD